MKLLLAFVLTLSTVISLSAQQAPAKEEKKDTIYYTNENGFVQPTRNRKDAVGYAIKKEYRPYHYVRKVIFLDEPKLMVSYQCYDQKYVKEDLSDSSIINVKDGAFEERYLNGQTKMLCKYVEDKLDGDFKMFYPSGQIKRHDIFKLGVWVTGRCFDENGIETPYCDYVNLPEFPGGREALVKYLAENIKYPDDARSSGVEGTASYSFIVDTDGLIYHIRALMWLNSSINKECLRVIKSMPKWQPGKCEGVPTKFRYYLPIRFKLSD